METTVNEKPICKICGEGNTIGCGVPYCSKHVPYGPNGYYYPTVVIDGKDIGLINNLKREKIPYRIENNSILKTLYNWLVRYIPCLKRQF